MRTGPALLALVLLATAGPAAACTSGSPSSSPSSGPSNRTTSARPGTGATTSSPPSPFTGQPATNDHVLAVKIDNVAPARPATGLTSADVVYVEPVEGGLSRILAIFASKRP